MPKLMTFLISAVIHELIITYALGFFYPILFILFTGPGIILIQNTKNLKSISVNLAFWLEMYIGGSLLFTTYLIESFARKRISDEFIYSEWGNVGYFIPRTFYLGEVAV
jgi:sterol O-acyltransferase